MKFIRELDIAKQLAIEAGKKIMGIYNSEDFDIQEKENDNHKSPLTKADLAANKIIVTQLRENFPEYAILTEEEVDNKERLSKEFIWIIDPLDGTKEFIKRNGEFTVNIALVHGDIPILGAIYVPVTDELYYATKDKGVFYEKAGNISKITVTDKNKSEDMVFVKSRSHASEKLVKFIEIFKFAEVKISGSSIKGCLVAKGEADVYLRLGPVNEWDVCAMDVIVRESGGRMTDLEGKPLKYNKDLTLITSGFLVSNDKMHQELLDEVDKFD